MSVRYPLLVSIAGVGFVISVALFLIPVIEVYRSEHRRLLALYAPVIDAPAQAYVQCFMAQGCFAQWSSAVNTVAPLPFLGVLASLVLAACGLDPK